jgi:hypothetical protein
MAETENQAALTRVALRVTQAHKKPNSERTPRYSASQFARAIEVNREKEYSP